MYKNKVHDDYMSDITWSVIIIFAYCCGYAYSKIRTNAEVIRTNWIDYRCNPAYMIFAGNVMKPDADLSDKIKFTQDNFQFCVQNELKTIAHHFMDPIYYTQSIVINTLHGIANALNSIRELINHIRNAFSSIMSDVMSRGLNIMQPIIAVFISLRDLNGKVQGIMTTSLYTLLGIYNTLVSGLRSTFEIIVIILIAMGAAIIALWVAIAIAIAFGPFGLPALIAATATVGVLTAIFIGIAIPLGIIAHFLARTMKINGLSMIPGLPRK
jgi:hypothetical protein